MLQYACALTCWSALMVVSPDPTLHSVDVPLGPGAEKIPMVGKAKRSATTVMVTVPMLAAPRQRVRRGSPTSHPSPHGDAGR